MRRAEVYREVDGTWWVDFLDRRRSYPDLRIAHRPIPLREHLDDAHRPTHAEALVHALAEVGLDKPVEHREAP